MYTAIGSVKSRAFRVLWMLEELEQPYTYQPQPPQSDAVQALNGSGKIPVLLDGAHVISDSVAIVQYLADKHHCLTYVAGTPERAQQDSWTQMILDELDAVLWAAARHSFVLPEDKRVPEVKSSLRWEFAQSMARLVTRMGPGPFLMGAQITVPDIILTHCARWAKGAKFDGIPQQILSLIHI